jgi:hypothetical protein
VVERVRPLLQPDVAADTARQGVTEQGVRVRGLLSCPPCEQQNATQTWCLTGSEILRFAHHCFNPPARRSGCSTRYSFYQWVVGSPLSSITSRNAQLRSHRPWKGSIDILQVVECLGHAMAQ